MTSRDRRSGSLQHKDHDHNLYPNFSHHTIHQFSMPFQPSDYESDTPYDFSDTQQQVLPTNTMPALPTRSSEELNFSVLYRHNTEIASILSLAPYAVVYIFNPSTKQWEKSGIEGSMFVCQMVQGSLGEERYGVFVLNRRGLDNFDIRLTDGENVELTENYVILKTDEEDEEDIGTEGKKNVTSRIYGLWIYSEPSPNSTAETQSINAQVIKECAIHAGQSLKLAQERQDADQQNGHHQPALSSVPMSRQISLKELFGLQRAQDDEWSVKVHSPGGISVSERKPFWLLRAEDIAGSTQTLEQDILGDLFRKAGLAYQSG